MSTCGPYRVPPVEPLPACDGCGNTIVRTDLLYEGKLGQPICKSCFIGQYDLLALFGVGALTAGAISSSGALLVCGVLVPALGAYAIYKKGI
jgi:hypothetical protein